MRKTVQGKDFDSYARNIVSFNDHKSFHKR